MIRCEAAIERIEAEFPELSRELHDEVCDRQVHLQIAAFARRAQAAIDCENRPDFQRVCRVFLELFRDAEPDLRNALYVSFLEHLHFVDGKRRRSWAYGAMPPQMRVAFDEIDDYNRQLHRKH